MSSYDYEDMYQAIVNDAEQTESTNDELVEPLVPKKDVVEEMEPKKTHRCCRKLFLFLVPMFAYLLFGVILPHGGGGPLHRAVLIDVKRPAYDPRMIAAFIGAKYLGWLGQAQVVWVNTNQCQGKPCDHYQDKLVEAGPLDEVQFWGQGGYRYYFHPRTNRKSALQFLTLLQDTGTLPKKGGLIWLKTSMSTSFARDLAVRSGCYVVCYTDNVHFFMGRAKGFAPNGTMTTPDDGIDTNFSHLSMPWDPRTDAVSQMKLPSGLIPNH